MNRIIVISACIAAFLTSVPPAAQSVDRQKSATEPIGTEVKVLPADIKYFHLRDGLANCKAKFEKDKTGRVAFLGGSITFNGGWRDELMQYFRKRFPETKFDFIAAGIPSVGSVGHAFRLQPDILMRGPVDLLFVEAAVNDNNYDGMPDSYGLALRGMEGVVRHIRTVDPMTDIVEMHFINGSHLTDFSQGKVPYTVAAHEKVAEHYGCTSLNLSREVYDRIQAGEFTWASGFHSDVHPPPFGQHLYAKSMIGMLDAGFATVALAKAHAIPAQLLDPNSYANGHYGKLADAKLGAGFKLDPKWNPHNGQPCRPGYVDCPAIVAEAPGAQMSYEFEGTGFGLFLAAGRDTGVIEYRIDGGPAKSLDTWTPWSGGLHLPWPLILADGLRPGKHKIVVRTTDQAKNRTALHIIHLLVN